MGQNGSSLVGKAVVDKKLMPFTTFGKAEILKMLERHQQDLGGR
jgi:hypothetical protein